MNKQPHPAVSVTSLASASSTSSGASATSADGQSSSMATSTSVQKMDSELRCPACRRYFYCPLLLPCGHSLCTSCAAVALIPSSDPQVNAIVQASTNHPSEQYTTSVGTSCSSASSTTGSSIGSSSQTAGNNVSSQSTGCATTIHQSGSSNPDSDQVSVLSETDSGVVVTSRPGSCINRLPVLVGHPYSSTSSTSGLSLVTHGLVCPTCNQIVGLFDDRGIGHLPRNRALERIVNKFVSPELLQQNVTVGVAAVWCEQCEIFYCSSCKEKCHPSRGPLLRHILHSAAKGVEIIQQKRQNQSTPCPAHPHMLINLYCVNCHTPICHECLGTEGSFTQDQHGKHEVQSLHAVCKAKKVSFMKLLLTNT
ncbi:tripartite motif-containing protein 9/67 [Paragonimus westermani]|uniref:Tripartite motif-containing protein 9/67 n=1 Tax=Paragonimus westermani TaxID=34504 RepID=A0A5J4NXN2_9TREM|nr:tripartite motif-containing protein 9/67 [Paragonimus westermani]